MRKGGPRSDGGFPVRSVDPSESALHTNAQPQPPKGKWAIIEDKIYTIGNTGAKVIAVAVLTVLVMWIIGMLKSEEIEELWKASRVQRAFGTFGLLYGIYALYFNKRLAEEQVSQAKKSLQNKSKVFQKLYSLLVSDSYSSTRFWIIFQGVVMILMGLIYGL